MEANEIVNEMVVLLRGEANQYAVSMRTDLGVDLPMITADRVQVQQVLMNLMLNAIEAMKDTGGVVTVRSQLDGNGQMLISVSDTGVGLPAEKANQIFEAFFTTKAQGTGLGLAIVGRILEEHGGHLELRDASEKIPGARGAWMQLRFTAEATEAPTAPAEPQRATV